MFFRSIYGSSRIKDKDFIAKHMRDEIMKVGPKYVLQIIIDIAVVCKVAGMIIGLKFPSIH